MPHNANLCRISAINRNNHFTQIVLVAILILATALRLVYLLQIQSNPLPEIVTKVEAFDQYRFMEPAKEFLKGNWLGFQVLVGSTIAYSYLIAFLYTFFPQNTNTLFIFQMLLGLLAVYIFYRSASLLFNNKNIGLIAAFIAAFYSPFLFQECNMERGAVIAYTNLLGFYFLLKAIRRHKVRYFFIAGLMIGISTAMRENVLAVFILAYILFVVKERYKFKIASIAAFLVGVVIIVSPFLIRNKIVGNTSSFERTGTEYFWLGNRDKLKMYCTQPYFMYNKSVK
jgi:4-amino-4-deoxy-L-arabinose transferase-like glycosyltransferase